METSLEPCDKIMQAEYSWIDVKSICEFLQENKDVE